MFRLLLCPSDYYGIEYEINPWMDRSHKVEPEIASAQWQELRHTLLALGCELDLIAPQAGLPDMVFTANAGLVVGREFIRSNFRHPQRQGEAEFFEQWFSAHGYDIVCLPRDLIFEGEGDALFCSDVLFCGYHFRSDIQSHQWLSKHLGCLVISAELVDPRFYPWIPASAQFLKRPRFGTRTLSMSMGKVQSASTFPIWWKSRPGRHCALPVMPWCSAAIWSCRTAARSSVHFWPRGVIAATNLP